MALWSDLPRAVRDAIAADYTRRFGWKRRGVRERYNRGTLDLYLFNSALDNISYQLGEYRRPDGTIAEFHRDAVYQRLLEATPQQRARLAVADAEEIRAWAKFQTDRYDKPSTGYDARRDVATGVWAWLWTQTSGIWVNVAWYH